MGRLVKVCIAGLTLLLTIATAIAIGIVFLVSRGPVSLAPVTPYLEDALADELAPYRVGIEDTILSWDSDADRLDLRAVNVRLADEAGGTILSLPQMSVTLSAGQALRGRAVVTKTSLIRARVNLLREADGGWYLVQADGSARWPLNLGGGATSVDAISLRRLQHIAVVDASVTLTDAGSGVSLELRSATGELSLDDGRLVGRATARVQFAGSEAAVGVGLRYQGEAEGLHAAINIAELDVASLGRLLEHSALRELSRFNLTASGRIDIEAAADGGHPTLNFDLSTGSGHVSIPESFANDLAVSGVQLVGRGRVADRTIDIDEFKIDLGEGPTLAFAGRLMVRDGGPAIDGALTATSFPTSVLRSHWPQGLASGARSWVFSNIKAGTISNLKLALALPADAFRGGTLPDGAAVLTWDFAGVTSTYLGDLPALQEGRGQGRVSHNRFDLRVDEARVEGGLVVSDGKLTVPDINAEVPVLELDFVTRGAAASVLSLLNRPPLGLPSKIGLDPTKVGGQSATATRLTVPLLDDVTIDEVGYSAAANLTDVSLPAVWRDWNLSEGELTLRADREALILNGRARVNGIPMELDWRRPIDGKNVPSMLKVRATSNVEQLAQIGIDASEYGSGRLGLGLDLALADEVIGGQVNLDLTGTALALSDLNWSKPAGRPASARFRLRLPESGGIGIEQLVLVAPALEVEGDVRLDGTGRLVALVAPRVALNGSTLRLDIRQANAEFYDVAIAGSRLDLRPFELSMKEVAGGRKAWPAPVRLQMNLAEIIVADDLVLNAVAGSASRGLDRWEHADISGRISNLADARAVLLATDYGYRLNFASNDAGAAARAFGIYDNAAGGQMYLKARIEERDGESPLVRGVLRADDFVMENAPLIARVLTLGSLRGINDAIAGNGIAFTRLELPFAMQGETVRVEKGRAVGPALGLTGDLEIDNASETIKANGTLIPAYSINSVLGNIPIIGKFLVGRPGEGVFALTFQIEGPTADPLITVNPLSALAPGFLRRILEGLEQPTRALDDDIKIEDPGATEHGR